MSKHNGKPDANQGTVVSIRGSVVDAPHLYMELDRLFSALIRQYLFVSLYWTCAESLASANASRLAAMQGAAKNIDERLAELQALCGQQRQAAITAERLDIAAGFEALTQPVP
jgi:F-type H+-transporting ATPase subunit gamma